MTTRRVHLVRVKNKNNEGEYADVKVIDAVALRLPNGEERLYDVTAKNAVPYMKDKTGDGNDIGTPSGASRASHLARLKGSDDDSQMLDVEILDAFALRGPNGEQLVISLPASKATTVAIKDDTGSGLKVAVTAQSTRALHVVKIAELAAGGSTSTADQDYPSGDITDNYAIVLRLDALALHGPNGYESLLITDSAADEIDTTQYVTDDNGDKAPPDNADPNPYVRWPDASEGPWIRKNPSASDGTMPAGISQGPLWWITKLSGRPAVLALSFSGFNNAPTGFGFLTSCQLVTPDGTAHPLFSNINSIGTGNSANLKLPAAAVFTADPVYSFGPIAQNQQPGLGPYNNYFSYQTVFVNLAKFTAQKISGTSDRALRFQLTVPAQPMTVNAVQWFVAWDLFGAANLLGPPTNYERTVVGVTIFDQAAALHAIASASPTLMCAQVFETSTDAADYAALHNLTGDYYLTEMYIDALALGGDYRADIQTFDGTKKDPDHPHGPYQFPISVPVLNSSHPPSPIFPNNSPPTRGIEDFNWEPWPIGFETASAAWPADQNFTLTADIAEDVTINNPAKTLWFDVIVTANATTKDGKYRVRFYGTTAPPPLS
jgi:hypothetical protein